MPDTSTRTVPIARSPITVPGPRAVVDGWEVSTRRSAAALRLADASPLAKLGVRASADGAFARALDVPFLRSRRDGDVLVVGSGPGEWLLVGGVAEGARLREAVTSRTGDDLVHVVDLTHGRALVRLTGRDAARALSKVCAIDLDDRVTPDGSAFRTSVAKIATDVVRDDAGAADGEPSYLLHCERSSGQYLFDCLLDAGREFAIEPAGSDLSGKGA